MRTLRGRSSSFRQSFLKSRKVSGLTTLSDQSEQFEHVFSDIESSILRGLYCERSGQLKQETCRILQGNFVGLKNTSLEVASRLEYSQVPFKVQQGIHRRKSFLGTCRAFMTFMMSTMPPSVPDVDVRCTFDADQGHARRRQKSLKSSQLYISSLWQTSGAALAVELCRMQLWRS